MDNFQKESFEKKVLKELIKYDDKYKCLIKSEKPDYQSENPSIGLEITIAEDQGFLDSFNYRDKTLLDYARMKKISPHNKRDFAAMNKVINDVILGKDVPKCIIADSIKFICSYYYKKKDLILPIESLYDYYKLDPSVVLYSKFDFSRIVFFDGYKIKVSLLSTAWTRSTIDKIIESIKIKNEKFKKYKKFEENILAIINFTCDDDDLEQLETEMRKLKNINFDKIIFFPGKKSQKIIEVDF